MTQEVTPAGFALGQFNLSSPKLNPSEMEFVEREGTLYSYHLYRLGCMLEDRVLLAQGIRLGIFKADAATAWLVEDDRWFQNVMRSHSVEENRRRLPMYIPTEELLNAGFSAESSDADQFRSMLFLRSYISTLNLDGFYEELLFASDSRWPREMEGARSGLDQILHGQSGSLPTCYGIYDAVQLCSDLLAWHDGTPLGSADPWGVTSKPAGARDHRLRLRHLSKFDKETPQLIREAARLVRDTERDAAQLAQQTEGGERVRTIELLEEALLLKVLHFARLPELTPEQVIDARTQIIATLLPSDETVFIQRLGPQFAWTAALWRIAPADERSLIRASESAALTSEALSVLQESEH